MTNLKTGLICTVCALAFTRPALAQEVSDTATVSTDNSEIIVTAQRRSERLSDVPVAVTAIDGDDMQRLRMQDATQIVQQIPNVTAQATFGASAPLFALVEPDYRYPLIDKACTLSGAEMAQVINPTRKYKIEDRAAATLQPCFNASSRLGHYLELHRPICFLLDAGGSITDLPSADDVTDFQLNEITTAKLAIDS